MHCRFFVEVCGESPNVLSVNYIRTHDVCVVIDGCKILRLTMHGSELYCYTIYMRFKEIHTQ